MIYVVALNIMQFERHCRINGVRADGKDLHTGEQVMRYVHRDELLRGVSAHTNRIYLCQDWTQRVDYPSLVYTLKAFYAGGGRVEGSDVGYVIPYKRFNRHLGTRSGGNDGLRVISGASNDQPRRPRRSRRGVVR